MATSHLEMVLQFKYNSDILALEFNWKGDPDAVNFKTIYTSQQDKIISLPKYFCYKPFVSMLEITNAKTKKIYG